MHLFKTTSAAVSFALSVFVGTPLVSQELPSIYPGVTTLGERTIPAPVGLSPEMLEVVKERQIPPFIPAPNNTDDWLKFQAMFDKAGVELGLAAVAHNEAT